MSVSVPLEKIWLVFGHIRLFGSVFEEEVQQVRQFNSRWLMHLIIYKNIRSVVRLKLGTNGNPSRGTTLVEAFQLDQTTEIPLTDLNFVRDSDVAGYLPPNSG